jgi:hypothetical protein
VTFLDETVLYDLTPLTGRKATSGRTVVIMTYDVNYVLARVVLLSLLPSMLVGAIVYPLMHAYAVVVVAVVEVVLATAFYARSSTGLQLRLWRRLWNKSRANLGKVYLRSVPVATEGAPLVMLTQASMPNPCISYITDADIFGATPAGPRPASKPLGPPPERLTGITAHDWYA